MDKATLMLRGIMRILIGNFPVRAGIGALIGLVLDGLRLFIVGYFSPFSSLGNGLSEVPLTSEISLGILMSFLTLLLPGRRILPEQFTSYFNILDEAASRLQMSRPQKFLLYQPFFKSLNEQMAASKALDMQKAVDNALKELSSDKE